MTEQTMTTPMGAFTLQRQPHAPHLPLQAWDSADSFLLELLTDDYRDITVVNVAFGALTVSLNDRVQQSWSDSEQAAIACRRNATLNGLDADNLMTHWLPMSHNIAEPRGVIVLKIPKSMALLHWQLQSLSAIAPEGAELWLAGMDKHIRKSQFDAVAQYFGPVNPLKGRKKARVWQATNAKQSAMPPRFTPGYVLPNTDIMLAQTPGIFCGNQLDMGTRLFLDSLHQLPKAALVGDLGCGNGVLGLAYLKKHPDAEVVMVDESAMAVACAEENLLRAFGESQRSHAFQADAMPLSADRPFDLIVCNPPFHQGTTVTTELAQDLFKSAETSLRPGGQLWVVANRHLQYHVVLKKLFGRCTTVTGDSKFVILMVQKAEQEA